MNTKKYYKDMVVEWKKKQLEDDYKKALYLCEDCGAPVVVTKSDFRNFYGFPFDPAKIKCAYCGRAETVYEKDI